MKNGCVTAVYALQVKMYNLNFISLLETANDSAVHSDAVLENFHKYKKIQ